MKTLFKLALAVGLAAASILPAKAQQGLTTRFYTFTNGAAAYPIALKNGATVTVNSTNLVPVFRDRGMGFTLTLGGTNASSVTNLIARFNLYDGTRWTTTKPIRWTTASNGTNGVTDYTNVLKDQLDNMRQIALADLVWSSIGTGDTNTIWVSNVTASVFP